MRKLILSLFLGAIMLVPLAMAGLPTSIEVYGPLTGSNNSVCILPPHGTSRLAPWVTNQTVAAGSLWQAASGRTYLIVRGGLTAGEPIQNGLAATNGVSLMPVQGTTKLRTGFDISNVSTCLVYLSIGSPATNAMGIYLAPSNRFSLYGPGVPQDAVHAESATTNAVLLLQEW